MRIRSLDLLKVAFFCRFPFSPRIWYTYLLASALTRKGISVRLYGPRSNHDEIVYYEKVWSWLGYPIEVLRRCLRDDIDIINFQFEFPTFGIVGSFLLPFSVVLLRLAGVRCITTIHGPILPAGKDAERISKHIVPNNYRWIPIRLFKIVLRLLYILVERAGAKILVHAHVFRRWLVMQGLRDVDVIYHGVNTPGCFNKENRPALITCFGTISPRRGIEKFIFAVSEIADYLRVHGLRAVIAGNLPSYYSTYAKSIEKLVKSLKLNEIIQIKYNLSLKELEQLLCNSSLAVLPYEYSISASGALATVFEYHIPALVSRTEYFQELLGNEFVGMFDTKDFRALARTLLTVLSDSKMREQVWNQLLDRLLPFSWDKIAESYTGICLTITSKRNIKFSTQVLSSTGYNRNPQEIRDDSNTRVTHNGT